MLQKNIYFNILYTTLPYQLFFKDKIMNNIEKKTNTSITELPSSLPTIPSGLRSISFNEYGNKHANLIKLYDFLKTNPIKGVEVPLPKGISTQEIFSFLEKMSPSIFTLWIELGKLYQENPLHFESPQVNNLIDQIQKEIFTAFEKFAQSPEITFWLDGSKDYMVRSSGAEDSLQAANAGGNLSCSYVSADQVALHIGLVVASYFGKQSLLNRIASGENPFSSPLHLAVTIQELIGEPIGGAADPFQIPISLVVFSNEPIYTNKEFSVMKISCGFGHGEGVVGKKGIATETAFVSQSLADNNKLYVWYDLQEKPERLAPVKKDSKVELEAIENPPELVHQKALNDKMIKRLFILAKKIETFFCGPTDIELVIKEEIIYIVQARPINRKESLPTYLDLESSKVEEIKNVKVLVSGKNSAFSVTESSQVLVNETLEAAQFLVKNHQLVIVKEDEPSNSHPTINMTERQIPCIQTNEDIEGTINHLNNPGEVLGVCVQQELIATAHTPEEFFIREGYISHPAPLRCPLNGFPARTKKTQIPQDLQNLIKQIKLSKTKEVALETFEKLSLAAEMQNLTNKVTYAPLQTKSKEVEKRIFATLRELKEAILRSKKDEKMQILFYAKALETLMWGSGYSIINMQELSEELSGYTEKLRGKEAHLAELALLKPLGQETQEAWINFLMKLETDHSKEDVQKFIQVIEAIGDARLLWFTLFFAPACNECSDSVELLQRLTQGFSESTENFLKQLQKTEKSILKFKCDVFADPKVQSYSNKRLLEIISFLKDPQISAVYKESPPIIKMAITQVFSKAIDLYDKSLKALKSSPEYHPEIKLDLFKQMLRDYFSTLEFIALTYVGNEKFKVQTERGNRLEDYLMTLKELFTSLPKASHSISQTLALSSNYTNTAAILGSGTLINRHLPNTLEDFFTLIHQNLLACINRMHCEVMPAQLCLPSLPQKLIQHAENFRSSQCIGIEQSEEALILSYNVPLRNHSSSFQIIFKNEGVVIKIQLLGQARKRWKQTNQYLHWLDKTGIQPLAKKPILKEFLLDFSWKVQHEGQINQLFQIIDSIYESSLIRTYDPTILLEDFSERIDLKLHQENKPYSTEFLTLIQQSISHFKKSERRYGFVLLKAIFQRTPSINILEMIQGLSLDSDKKLTADIFEFLTKIAKDDSIDKLIRLQSEQMLKDSIERIRKSIESSDLSNQLETCNLLTELATRGLISDQIQNFCEMLLNTNKWELQERGILLEIYLPQEEDPTPQTYSSTMNLYGF